jgi:hypothetical protein
MAETRVKILKMYHGFCSKGKSYAYISFELICIISLKINSYNVHSLGLFYLEDEGTCSSQIMDLPTK